MAAWIGPAIGAVGSVISSLFGGKKKTSNRVDYVQMVADAEAAGFNPLTVLRNGGSAGYMQTAHPGLSSAEIIGGGLSQVGNFLADFDPFADDKRELESRLVEAQIANLNASTADYGRRSLASPGSFNVPQSSAGQIERRPSGQAAALGKPGVPEAGDLTVTNPWQSAVVDPKVRDASAFEERYGDSEIFQMLYGGYVGASDIWANLPKSEKTNDRMTGALSARSKEHREKARKREERLRRDAARNARELGFPGY